MLTQEQGPAAPLPESREPSVETQPKPPNQIQAFLRREITAELVHLSFLKKNVIFISYYKNNTRSLSKNIKEERLKISSKTLRFNPTP